MTKTDPTSPGAEPTEPGAPEESFYEVPVELDDDGAAAPTPPPRDRRLALKVAAGVIALLVAAAGLIAYRAHHRRAVLKAGLARADELLRLDTAAGYREAAALLEPLAQLDHLEAGSVRAFALAMLFADYRDAGAEAEAAQLLVEPGRAEVVPRYAHLADAALALGRSSLGDATTAASAAQGGVWAEALQARIALRAGTLSAAIEPAAAAAEDGAFAAGLAIEGDVARRARNDPAAARASYAAALAASPTHPRAAFGLAKLALAGRIPPDDAVRALRRLLGDPSTPAPERGRAALHLAALQLRAGDRAGGAATLDSAGMDAPVRAWAERAAEKAAASRNGYEVADGTPAALQSASDDDPWVAPPPAPIPDHVGADPLDARPPLKHAAAKPYVKQASAKATGKKATTKKASKTAAKGSSAKKSAQKATTKKKAAETAARAQP
ncbi:MAG TPA: hypothetical protein VML50_09840 [Anaeromyxobacter sp.]|nr:hypothetical protein [Anaeromyxobacter sp.]